MSERTIKAGTNLFWGRPANPMPKIMADAISQAVTEVPGISEAHLPQCFIEGDKEARQVLVIGVHRPNETAWIANELTRKFHPVLPTGQFLDIIPFKSGSVPPEVQQAGCQIFVEAAKPWWKIW
jgi:hypothetical protein